MKDLSKVCFVVGVCLANVIAGESWSVLLRSHSVYSRRNFTYNSSSTSEPTPTGSTTNLTETNSNTSTESSTDQTTNATNLTSTNFPQQNATGTTAQDLGVSSSSSSSPTSSDSGLSRSFRRRINSTRSSPLLDRDWKGVNREVTTQSSSFGSSDSSSTPATINLKLPTESASNASSSIPTNGTGDSALTIDNSTKTGAVESSSIRTLSFD